MLQACLLPSPKGTSCVNYARCVYQILQGLRDMQVPLLVEVLWLIPCPSQMSFHHSYTCFSNCNFVMKLWLRIPLNPDDDSSASSITLVSKKNENNDVDLLFFPTIFSSSWNNLVFWIVSFFISCSTSHNTVDSYGVYWFSGWFLGNMEFVSSVLWAS